MAGIGVNIVVNDFMFCAAHGLEYCGRCCCDHRMINNVRIEDAFPEGGRGSFDIEERQPIDAYALGAVPRGGSESYSETHDQPFECSIHRLVDCARCFNWVRIIREEASQVNADAKWLEKRRKWLDKVDH